MNEIKISVLAYKELLNDNIKLTKEIKELLEERDNNNEIIQSLHDEISARNCYTQKVIAENNRLQKEMEEIAKDHEEEMIDRINSSVTMHEIRILTARFIHGHILGEDDIKMLIEFIRFFEHYIDNKHV